MYLHIKRNIKLIVKNYSGMPVEFDVKTKQNIIYKFKNALASIMLHFIVSRLP